MLKRLLTFAILFSLYQHSFGYAVTFRVDMTNVTGFTVANVNGTFNNWCGACAPMSDANADNIWELTINLNAGTYQYKFTYNGWTGQETLIPGSSCTVTASGFTNRSLVVSGDVVLPVVCYGACTSCAQVLPSYPVTFQVDMNQQTGFTTPEVNGTFNSWCGNCAAMTDANGDGIWQKTIVLQQGSYEYKFSADNWTTQENLTPGSSCTVTTGSFTNRTLNVTGAVTLDPVCWNSCSICSQPPVNVTFQLDMSQYTGPFTTPEINGTFNGWCGSCNPMSDVNGDNIWEITLPLVPDTFDYKFSFDNWTGQENLTSGLPCTQTVSGFTNRRIIVTAAQVLSPVCWESCAACLTSVNGCTDVNAANYNPSATQNDGSCLYTTTFNADMTCAGVAFTNPYVTGPWCGWCGAQSYNLLTDANGDGIYTVSIDLAPGVIEYKYMVDDWASQENLIDDMQNGGTCAQATDYSSYANRLTNEGTVNNDVYGSCTACPTTPSCDLLTLLFGDASTIMPWTPVADAVLPEASQTWDPSGAMIIGGTNTTSNGRAYVYQFLTNTMNYNNSSSIDVAFDIKVVNPLVGAALHLQNEFPGIGTVNNFDLQNAGINSSTWTHLTYNFTGVTAGSLFRMQFNIAAGAFPGAGGSVMIDNITVTCNGGGGVAGCTDAAAANYNAAATVDDGSCLYTTTFNVDMSCAGVTFTNPYVTGPWCGWCGAQPYNLLTDADGDGIYTVSVDLAAGTVEYKYMVDDWASQENLIDDMQNGGTCAPVTDYANYANRTIAAGSVSSDAYGKCGACGAVYYNVTFQLDMSQYAGTFTTPEINGTFNSWCGNCFQMSDANGDNVWDATTQLQAGAYEFKFAYDNWTGQETLTDGSACTITTNGFTNRLLTLTSDTVLSKVCWESCNACVYPFVGNFSFFAGGKCNFPWLVSGVVIDPATGIGVADVIWSNGGTMDTIDFNTFDPLSGFISPAYGNNYYVTMVIADLNGNIQYSYTYPMELIDGVFYDITFAGSPMSPFYFDCGAVEELQSEVNIFPNPSNGNIQITGAFTNPYTVSVIDVNGRIVHVEKFQSPNANLKLGHLADGVYQLRLSNDSDIKSSTIIIKK